MKIQFLLFCILIILSQALWAKQSSLSFNEIKALHYKSALHWADREMARLINEGKQQNTSDSLLGEYYKQRALIALDASYPMQYKRWVDSMYFYKAKLNKPIYFVEYATYQL
ncbi:MAG: hypothetical protein WD512_20415, partial [Candidatus Paceibacterota bacterium]